MNKIHFIIFLIIVFSVYFGLHYYVYHRIVNGLLLPERLRFYLRIIFVALGVSFIAAEFLKRTHPVYWIIYLSSVWLGIICISFSVFIVKDLTQLILRNKRQILTLISLVVIFFSAIYSIYNVNKPPRIKEIKLKLSKLPSHLKGFSLVQISDTHFGILTRLNEIEALVQQVNLLNSDLIVITGDLIDRDICEFNQCCSLLKKLKSRYGVYAVTGNHEFYAGIDKFEELARRSGISLLRNKKHTIADSIELIGIDDKTVKRFTNRTPDITLIIEQCDKKKPVILLNHQPIDFEKVADMGVDLQLSGHTHAGQLPPVFPFIHLIYKYVYGLHQYQSSYIYTTSGTGIWGPPMRLFSRSEIVKFILE